jgi:glycosyltransferase involved in cell wall biosynthesis
MAINDGSTDDTAAVLDAIPHPELRIWHRHNVGHGPSCRFGYDTAVELGVGWVLQIDSDGQCDPAFLSQFWPARKMEPVIFGDRVRRDDGIGRWLISRMVSLEVFLHTGRWIKDANVPYRLIRTDRLKGALERLPENALFANILLSYLLAEEIRWKPIRFRKRAGGTSTLKPGALVRFASRLSHELRELKRRMNHGTDSGKKV